MEGIAATSFGNRILREAAKSESYARMLLGMTRHEQLEHVRGAKYACAEGCAGCRELARVVAGLEQLIGEEEIAERYP